MDAEAYHALSPLDGRYKEAVKELRDYFSEYALMKYRIRVEVAYFIALSEEKKLKELPEIATKDKDFLKTLYLRLDDKNTKATKEAAAKEIEKIKKHEQSTKHDVKAVEYYIKDQLRTNKELKPYVEFVHFGLTSQDINNTAQPLALHDAHKGILYPELIALIEKLKAQVEKWKDIHMLAHTHGQPATPTHLGKEMDVFRARLESQCEQLTSIDFRAKFGGATGGMHAHKVSYPGIDWEKFAAKFLGELGLVRSAPTTQIEPYDHLAAYADAWGRIATILIDYSRDMWQYISMRYFTLKQTKKAIGSSAMPHKVNPIDFENAEGNLGLGAGFA